MQGFLYLYHKIIHIEAVGINAFLCETHNNSYTDFIRGRRTLFQRSIIILRVEFQAVVLDIQPYTVSEEYQFYYYQIYN